ncbi:cellular tumor antigen p53-like isoform X1 [Tigriopus californicus]|uniref:cellular tumor antigen p53-like isoform X1 n=1 Tax=Tigriopus californicus TaxID=6832 RepID=UPI0027D9D372|nr:cellular tumor antigen p53-like isoform X1 [Tigriopus californicus]
MVIQGNPNEPVDRNAAPTPSNHHGYEHQFLVPSVPYTYHPQYHLPYPSSPSNQYSLHPNMTGGSGQSPQEVTHHTPRHHQPQRSPTHAPLTEDELQQLQTDLRAQGVSETFTRLVDQPATSQSSNLWTAYHTPSEQIALQIGRSDTLERHPGFANPNDISGHNHMMLSSDESLTNHVKEALGLEPANPNQTDQAIHGDLLSSAIESNELKTKEDRSDDGSNVQLIRVNTDNTCTVITNFDTTWGEPMVGTPESSPKMRKVGETLSPTSAHPSTEQWEGDYGFKISFIKLTNNGKNKTWDFSERLNKLFIIMAKSVNIAFSLNQTDTEGFYVRALPIFALAGCLSDPVKRCPNHASPSDSSNQGFPPEHREHLVRVSHDGVVYEEDPVSKRLSVIVPLEKPQGGTTYTSYLYKFMCLSSDVGGINRKPIKLIFTLEQGIGNVVGRVIIDLKLCTCPKRDRQQDETRAVDETQKLMDAADGLARSNSVFTKPSGKKRKIETEEFVMVPVAKQDFEKINEFAEAAVIMRNMAQANKIKEERQKLLDMHNKKLINRSK